MNERLREDQLQQGRPVPPPVNVDTRQSSTTRTGIIAAIAVILGLIIVIALANWNASPTVTEQTVNPPATTEIQPATPPAPAPSTGSSETQQTPAPAQPSTQPAQPSPTAPSTTTP